MDNIRILDNKGTWVMNRSEFRMPDPENNVIYEPGLKMKVSDTEWRKERKDIIVDIADPFEEQAGDKTVKPVGKNTITPTTAK